MLLLPRVTPLATIASLIVAAPVRAETQVAAYLGVSSTAESDVTLAGQSFRAVQWETRSLRSPPYYGLRAAYFFERSGWGLAIDFFHDKAYAASGSMAPALSRLSFSRRGQVAAVSSRILPSSG